MDFINKIINIVKSPIGSIAIRLVIPLTKIGISWTPTKKDDYYLCKIAFEIIEGQVMGYDILGLPAPFTLLKALVMARQNLELAEKLLKEQKQSKMKKK